MIEVYVAAISAAGAVCSAAIAALSNRRLRQEKEILKRELQIQSHVLDFSQFISDWHSTLAEIELLMQETEIDRFLMFRAWNGKSEPQWTTAVLQIRRGEQKPIQYVHFELDDDYIERMRRIERGGYETLTVADMPKSAVKDVYEAEGVKASFWAHVETQPVDEHSHAISYCSFSSITDGELQPTTTTRCRIIVGRLKGVARAFGEK